MAAQLALAVLAIRLFHLESRTLFDVAVLMGGCDKTTPALIMGATSAGLPAIFFPSGPMIAGNATGKRWS